MKQVPTIIASFAFMTFAALGAGCNEADELRDCQEVCSRYKSCLADDDFNVGDCRNRCEDEVDKNKSLEDNLDDCAKCLDSDQTCGQSGWQCATQCASLVPVVANP